MTDIILQMTLNRFKSLNIICIKFVSKNSNLMLDYRILKGVNIAEFEIGLEIRDKVLHNKSIVGNIVMALLNDTDPPILVEVTRLMNACVANEDTRQIWLDAMDSCSSFKHFIYILENSLNVDLLQNTSELIDNLLDFSDELLKKWADINLVNAVCEALKQMRAEHLKTADVLLHVLQLLSTVESGVNGLVSCTSVVPLLCHFIAECGHDEGGIIVGRESSLTSCFSVLNVILVADPLTVLRAMEKETCIIKILLGLLRYSSKLHRKKSRNSSSFSEKFQDARKSKQLEDKERKTSDLQQCGQNNATDSCETKGSNSSSGELKGPPAEAEKGDATHNGAGEKYSGTTEESEEQKLSSEVSQTTSPAPPVLTKQNSSDDTHYCEDSVHHHYFTGAVMFLKDIVLHTEKVPGCVSRMLAPHEKTLEKVVHYFSRVKPYQQMVIDLVESTLSVSELSSLSEKLSQATRWPKKTS